MRATTHGRWLFRMVVTIGAGVFALGLSLAAARADVAAGDPVAATDQVTTQVIRGGLAPAPGSPVASPTVSATPTAQPTTTLPPDYVTEDWGWS
ncbi:hypothetical protein [Dactylosporangium sp. CA-139066]|uniref:hypothetical protein n=1 Tax=Dactylosporangium sp. CA-139066 TaxID=3239930 RepID=UPI003D94A1F0